MNLPIAMAYRGMDGERESQESVQSACLDDDDDESKNDISFA